MSEAATPIVKRLHISGLTPTFSKEALQDRLSSYGEVLALDGCDDDFCTQVGVRRTYAFATLRATPAQIARCMNTLSGAIWKGAKLRVGEAKPVWHERLAMERAKTAKDDPQARALLHRKKWLRKRPWIGMEAYDMSPITPERVADGEWGWKRTPTGHLVRPMHMRLTHPIPRPMDSERPPSRSHTVRRAPRVTIDPTRYTREHLTGSMLDALPDAVDHWRWVWDDEAAQWLAYDTSGACVATEAGPRARAVPTEVQDEDKDAWPVEIEPCPSAPENVDELPDTLFEQQDDVPDTLFDETQPATGHAASTAGHWWDEDESMPQDHLPTSTQARKTAVLDDSDFSDGYEETEHTTPAPSGHAEHARAMHLLQGLFGADVQDTSSAPAAPTTSPDTMHHEEEDEDDDEAIRALASTQAVSPESPSPMASAAAPEVPAVPASAPVQETVQMDSLKDMFQPTEEEGTFTLFGHLDEEDLDLDMQMDDVVTGGEAPVSTPVAPISVPMSTTSLPPMTTPWSMSSSTLLPTLFQRGSAPFWKVDTDQEIEQRWLDRRGEMTQTYRRMHREALKKRKRRVVGSRAGAQQGGHAPARGAVAG